MLEQLLRATHQYDLLENAHYKPFSRLRTALIDDGHNPNADYPDFNLTTLNIPQINTNRCFRHWQLAIINMLIEEYANAVLKSLVIRLNALSDAPVGTIIIDSDEFTFDNWEEWRDRLTATEEEIFAVTQDYEHVLLEFNVNTGEL